MHRTAGAMAAQPGQPKTLRHHALLGERCVAVDQQRHHHGAIVRRGAELVLLGAHLAEHHRIDDLEVRGIGGERTGAPCCRRIRDPTRAQARWYFTSPEPSSDREFDDNKVHLCAHRQSLAPRDRRSGGARQEARQAGPARRHADDRTIRVMPLLIHGDTFVRRAGRGGGVFRAVRAARPSHRRLGALHPQRSDRLHHQPRY